VVIRTNKDREVIIRSFRFFDFLSDNAGDFFGFFFATVSINEFYLRTGNAAYGDELLIDVFPRFQAVGIIMLNECVGTVEDILR
jgi:hypothetical protein